MTHSIKLIVKMKSIEDIKEVEERLLEDEDDSWTTMLSLRRVPKGDIYPDVQTAGKMPPFICFHKKEDEDDFYGLVAESGSHCGFDDIQESFPLWVSYFLILQEIESYGIDFEYEIFEENNERTCNLKQALKYIVSGSELTKYLSVKK